MKALFLVASMVVLLGLPGSNEVFGQKTTAKVTTGNAALPKLRKGSLYRTVRKQLLSQGWQPVTLPSATPCGDDPRCQGFPEVDYCVGANVAFCFFTWEKGGIIIDVSTSGEGDQIFEVLSRRPPQSSESGPKKNPVAKSSAPATPSPAPKCSVMVRNDLIPKRGVVVVGCDSFGEAPFVALNDDGTTRQDTIPSNGGLIVFDTEMNVIFRYEACYACGGFFKSFAGIKKHKGYNALLIKLEGVAAVTIPLYFDGKELRFIDKPQGGSTQ